MSRRQILFLTGCALILLCSGGWNYYQIQGYHQEIETLQMEKQILQQQSNAREHIYNQSLDKAELHLDYETWPHYFDAAEAMVKDSEGNFERPWAIFLVKEAEPYDIDPFLVYELLKVETGNTFKQDLVGPETEYGHAYGMAQFMKNTAPWLAEKANIPYEQDLLFNPYYSMKLSLVYLDFLYNQYGNWNEALTAYHRGMTGLQEYKEENGNAKSEYAVKIQRQAEKYQDFVAYLP
ncbi:lytic transglycosylase domain-containing protein [Gracilibacillus timonensis]|uniref:lytic transglycosylase domain-containing protein n=1 Tax=Gracilibacillus timonensis TaxID=1816696 RepID=UPI0008241CAE|nr:transglycosylase SLT domain-containing protein [Gracilibacillus timonensis]